MDGPNIEIDGIGFIAEELTADQSQSSREIVETKIFNGTEFVTQGEYKPMKWTFKTYLRYEKGYEFNELVKYLESKPLTVVSPLIGDSFTAIVRVTRNVSNALWMEFEIELTEVPDVTNYTVDNSLYQYRHLTIQEIHDQEE